jgi:hypothetical protein
VTAARACLRSPPSNQTSHSVTSDGNPRALATVRSGFLAVGSAERETSRNEDEGHRNGLDPEWQPWGCDEDTAPRNAPSSSEGSRSSTAKRRQPLEPRRRHAARRCVRERSRVAALAAPQSASTHALTPVARRGGPQRHFRGRACRSRVARLARPQAGPSPPSQSRLLRHLGERGAWAPGERVPRCRGPPETTGHERCLAATS